MLDQPFWGRGLSVHRAQLCPLQPHHRPPSGLSLLKPFSSSPMLQAKEQEHLLPAKEQEHMLPASLFQPGVNVIKLFWSKFTCSFCKLDHFIIEKNASHALKRYSFQILSECIYFEDYRYIYPWSQSYNCYCKLDHFITEKNVTVLWKDAA